jgi:hypothetical protein
VDRRFAFGEWFLRRCKRWLALRQGRRSLSGIQRKPMNWFLWAAVAAATTGIVLFTALWIDASRGTHTDDRRGAAGATLLAWCMGVATVLGIIGLVVKFW